MDDGFSLWSLYFGQRLGDIRRTRHLSQKQAAETIGRHHATLGQYEQGRLTPSLRTVYDLAHAYRVPMSQLFCEAGHPQSSNRPVSATTAQHLLSKQLSAYAEELPDLRVLRHRIGLSQEIVGRASGVSGSTLSRWESGQLLPDPDDMRRLAAALGCSPADVYLGVIVTLRQRMTLDDSPDHFAFGP